LLTPAHDTRGSHTHTPSNAAPALEPSTLAPPIRGCPSDWLALFAGVSLRHQVLLHATLMRAAGDAPTHD
jgi:hypothetical protein